MKDSWQSQHEDRQNRPELSESSEGKSSIGSVVNFFGESASSLLPPGQPFIGIEEETGEDKADDFDGFTTDDDDWLIDRHYKRNEIFGNITPATEKEAIDEKFVLRKEEDSLYHKFGAPANKKYTSQDGHNEAVYNAYGNLVTNPTNIGTYNKYPTGFDHFVNDVSPYWQFGNTPDNPTPWYDRIIGAPGLKNPGMEEADGLDSWSD